jgi:hypothetical protein
MTVPPQSPHPTPPRLPADDGRASNAITCLRCDAWWTGLKACHCTACHHTFVGIRSFDTHRRGGHCIDPVTIRTEAGDPALVPANRDWPGWSEYQSEPHYRLKLQT